MLMVKRVVCSFYKLKNEGWVFIYFSYIYMLNIPLPSFTTTNILHTQFSIITPVSIMTSFFKRCENS